MTAKQLRSKLIEQIRAGNPDAAEVLLKIYESQLCNEQREELLKACKFSSDGQYYYATEDDIFNCKQPEL